MKALKILVPLVAILLIAALAFWLTSSSADPTVSDRAESEDASAELVDFFDALVERRFAHAAQYVEANCEQDYCMYEGLSQEQIADELEVMCEDHICNRIEMEEVGEDVGSGVRSHRVAFLDADGSRMAFCADADCLVKKLTTRFRTTNVDGVQYVVDLPPLQLD